MIRFAIVLSALIAAAGNADARDATVRSGEHDGYTRLVVQVPPDTGWALKHTKNGARLNVALEDVTFRTESVFQRLTNDRLATISQTEPGAALEIEFGCDCAASAFLFQETMIVIDIAPGPVLPDIAGNIPPPVLPKAVSPANPPVAAETFDALSLPLFNQNAQGLENQLSTRLLQGVDRNIVDLNIAPVGPRASALNQSLFIPPELELNVSVTSVLDDLNGLLGPHIPQPERRPPCISTAELAFENWSDNRPFPEQVAALRSGLFQEFDALDETRALRLAKLYAYSGFGAESLRMLDLLAEPSQVSARIFAIARVLDGDRQDETNPFAGLQRCDSDAALWAALTEGSLQSDANLTAIEQSFARLPDHLRRHVGPPLSDILVDANRLEAARRVLRSVDRVQSRTSPDVTQVRARVATAEGDDMASESLLSEVISAPDAALEAPLALARLVDKRWLDRGAVSPQELHLADSYTVEFRNSEIGFLMRRTHALALSLAHEFDAALDVLSGLQTEAENQEALNRVVLILTERADDATFLRRVLALPQKQIQSLTTDTAIAAASRLATLGFSRQAAALAKRPQDRLERRARARIRAQAALLDQRPHQAMLELAEDASSEATALRAKALLAAGDYRAAADLMRVTGDPDQANRLFWLAGLPDHAEVETGAKYGPVARVTQSLLTAPPRQPETPLAEATRLLRDSAETRQRISELFAALGQD